MILIQTSASWKKYLRIRGKRLNGALSRRQTNPPYPRRRPRPRRLLRFEVVMEPRPILPGSCRMPFPALRRFRPAQRSRQTPAETGSETASRSRGPHWVHPRLKRECGHIVQWKSSPSQDRRSRRLGLGDHRQCDRLGVGDHDRRQQAIISADFALRDARQIEIRRHVTSPLSRKNRQELLLFRTFTAETWVRFALGAVIKTSGYAGHAAVGVIAGTLNITAYRGQWDFAPEL